MRGDRDARDAEVMDVEVTHVGVGDAEVVRVEVGACAPAPGVEGLDHRRWPRKRGAVLEEAIARAVVEELGDRGYAGLTFEGVAVRAGTGKSALYRRWSDKQSMVVDILSAALPDVTAFRPSLTLRDDLLTVLTMLTDACRGPMGLAVLTVAGCKFEDEEFARVWQDEIGGPWKALMQGIVADAIARGEARPGAAEDDCTFLGAEIVCQRFVMRRQAMELDEVERLVDHVLVPMMEARA